MKKIVFLVLVVLNIIGCSTLISVGDNNHNTHTIKKDLKWKFLQY